MSFLNSAFLFALAAVSIPLIIHFLSKRRIKTIEFSSLKFLEQMQKSRMRWLKIKELLLLLMRMAIIALIVMAFARPTLRGLVGSSKASSSAVILLDRSASMDSDGTTGSLFEEAKRIAGKLLDLFEPGDQITLMAFPDDGSPMGYGPYAPGDELKQRLGRIEQGYGKGKIGDILKDAIENLKKSRNLNREIYIISDFQNNGWSDLLPEITQRGTWENIHLFMIPLRRSGQDNIGITEILTPPQLLAPGQDIEIEAEIVNFGHGLIENLLAGVVVNGERKAQISLSLPAVQPVRAKFAFKIEKPGVQSGYIEIDHDSYALDNRRYFSLQVPGKIQTLAVSSSLDKLKFARLALDRPEAAQIAYSQIIASDLLRENLGAYDVILLYDLSNLDSARETALKNYINSGGALLVVLGRESDGRFWSSFLQNVGEIQVREMAGSQGEFIKWDQFDFNHPIFSVYAPGPDDRHATKIPEIELYRYFPLTGGKSIGSSSGNITLLTESQKAPVIVFGSAFDLNSGTLITHSFFVPFLVRSLGYLGSKDNLESFDGIIGQISQWHLPREITDSGIPIGELTIISPDSSVKNLNPPGDANLSLLNVAEYNAPGIYYIAGDGKTIGNLVFNIDNSESANDYITADQIQARLGITPRIITPESDLKGSVVEARLGKELWKEFLISAMILLIIESLLGRTSHLATKDEK